MVLCEASGSVITTYNSMFLNSAYARISLTHLDTSLRKSSKLPSGKVHSKTTTFRLGIADAKLYTVHPRLDTIVKPFLR